MGVDDYRIPLLITMLMSLLGCVSSGESVRADVSADRRLARGQILYKEHCVACHGHEGEGTGYRDFVPPPGDLTSTEVQTKSEQELLQRIHEGSANTAMPAWKWVLSEQEARDIVAYIQSLGERSDTR